MTVALDASGSEPSPNRTLNLNAPLWAGMGSIALFAIAAGTTWWDGALRAYLSESNRDILTRATFSLAILLPCGLSWYKAAADGKLAGKSNGEPYDHVSGGAAILLLLLVAALFWIVNWAAHSSDIDRKIHSLWGLWVVLGLAVAFLTVAALPSLERTIRQFDLPKPASAVLKIFASPVVWLGHVLSALDGYLVFIVAVSAGASLRTGWLRYSVLLCTISACGLLGYLWDAPWAFVPIVWAFLVAFSISRRWAWVEDDRELAMLNTKMARVPFRVGFDQDLRDEALVAFMSIFLLVPLALRQLQLFATANQIPLFDILAGVDVSDLRIWIGFYGTELAKAVPFVDWAEVYHVEGEAPIQAERALALHTIFATRVLIDLVFLAALLQAIATATREAQQRDQFKRGIVPRLDPFMEPRALRELSVRSDSKWVKNEKTFGGFPKYDDARLRELTGDADERVRLAANWLLGRYGDVVDPHSKLSVYASERRRSVQEIEQVIDEIEHSGPERNVYQLSLARERLLSRPSMFGARRRIVSMLAAATHSAQQVQALIAALHGEKREPLWQARQVALVALARRIGADVEVRHVFEEVSRKDGAPRLRGEAQQILLAHPDVA